MKDVANVKRQCCIEPRPNHGENYIRSYSADELRLAEDAGVESQTRLFFCDSGSSRGMITEQRGTLWVGRRIVRAAASLPRSHFVPYPVSVSPIQVAVYSTHRPWYCEVFLASIGEGLYRR